MRLYRWQLAAVFTLALVAYAQTSRGTVTGTILGASGAVIAGERITLTGGETGAGQAWIASTPSIWVLKSSSSRIWDWRLVLEKQPDQK
jgi:hypothetical protein